MLSKLKENATIFITAQLFDFDLVETNKAYFNHSLASFFHFLVRSTQCTEHQIDNGINCLRLISRLPLLSRGSYWEKAKDLCV